MKMVVLSPLKAVKNLLVVNQVWANSNRMRTQLQPLPPGGLRPKIGKLDSNHAMHFSDTQTLAQVAVDM